MSQKKKKSMNLVQNQSSLNLFTILPLPPPPLILTIPILPFLSFSINPTPPTSLPSSPVSLSLSLKCIFQCFSIMDGEQFEHGAVARASTPGSDLQAYDSWRRCASTTPRPSSPKHFSLLPTPSLLPPLPACTSGAVGVLGQGGDGSRAGALPADRWEEVAVLQGCGDGPEILRATRAPGQKPFKKACGNPYFRRRRR
ncbi:growth-regulating factor 3 [Phtheirospermum japonicum]|uniref:Growth-regulating factor 3 n=1 Tax=Phtheirospermum japonicum TaxID=374723 RepID=A0A830CNW2_9LAMI|nr:growth-regulating factor 3 [Phtheirospermum japonicum]